MGLVPNTMSLLDVPRSSAILNDAADSCGCKHWSLLKRFGTWHRSVTVLRKIFEDDPLRKAFTKSLARFPDVSILDFSGHTLGSAGGLRET